MLLCQSVRECVRVCARDRAGDSPNHLTASESEFRISAISRLADSSFVSLSGGWREST